MRGISHEPATVTTETGDQTISGTYPMSLRMPADLKGEVEQIARAEERSAASVIRHAVRVYIAERAA